MDPCKFKEPKVIDLQLIKNCISQQGPKGEAGRLAQLEPIPLAEVQKIRLEYSNILRIDHLWVLPGLTKLSLNNNFLDKIENLDNLVNLTELNLSFNKIEKIENLEKLTKLEILNLYSNKIQVIEGLEMQEKLQIFSLGKNEISDQENALYFRNSSNLKSLNMADNPCAENEDFRLFIAAFLPQLKYYEYRIIQDLERDLGREIFELKLRALEEIEEKDRVAQQVEEKKLRDAELYAQSFVEYLNEGQLFETLFEDDPDGTILLEMGDEADDIYNEFKEEVLLACKDLFEIGQEQYIMREKEIGEFQDCIREGLERSQEKSIKSMEEFLEKKAIMFYNVKKMQSLLSNGKIEYKLYLEKCNLTAEKYDQLIQNTWKSLMKLEMELYEQMEELNQNFEHSLTEMVNIFIESAQSQFSLVRSAAVKFNENISDLGNRFFTNLTVNPEGVKITKTLHKIMSDKDNLLNAIGASHDIHNQVIDNREDMLVSRIRNWLEKSISQLEKEEIARNRTKVLEINHFLDLQREEFYYLNIDFVMPGVKDEDNLFSDE